MNLGSLRTALVVNISQFRGAMNQVGNMARQLGNQFNNSFGSAGQANINATTQGVRRLQGEMKDLDRIVSGILISQMFYGSVQSIKEATSAMTGFMNNMEKAQIAMEYFLGTPERAQGFIMNMKDFAAVTAFNTEQALVLSRRLMGAQFRPEEIRSVMEILNDAAAATGGTAEQTDRIVLAMTQIKTQGKLAGQEMRQLAEAGIPIYKILQEELGLTGEQLKNLGDLKIDSDVALGAMMRGLQKRYEGAADRIADTVPGLWETIKDNVLMLGEDVFEIPYQAMKNFLTIWRDGMEEARAIATRSGLGGVFERFIPPELQTSIRTTIASIQSLWQSFRMMASAVSPVIQLVGTTFVTTLGQVMPVVAGITRNVSEFAVALFQSSPMVRYFAAAIGTLIVANTAAKALMFLWSVMRLGSIAMAVGGAIIYLARAIQFLTLAMVKNRLIAIVMVAASALLYLATSSGLASKWIDGLTARLAKLAGVDISDTLQPIEQPSMEDWIDQFNEGVSAIDDLNEGVIGVGDGLEDAGKKGKKAGKEIEKLFIASFDEVYQVPDQLDKVGDALDDIANGPGLGDLDNTLGPMPDMTVPKWPEFDEPPIPDIPSLKDMFDLPDMDPPGLWKAPWSEWKFPVSMFGEIGIALADALSKVTSWTVKVGYAIGQWAASTLADFLRWGITAGQHIKQWSITTAADIVTWIGVTGVNIKNWATETMQSFGVWAFQNGLAVTNWASGTLSTFLGWAKDTGKTILDWLTENGAAFGKWFKDTGGKGKQFVDDNVKDFQEWKKKTETSVKDWAAITWKEFQEWSVKSTVGFATWTTNTATNFREWARQTGTNLATWATTTGTQIKTWVVNTGTNIAVWATNASTNIALWATGAAKNIASWGNNAANNIRSWAATTGSNIASWVNTGVKNFAGFATASGKNIANWATGTAQNLQKWVSAAGGAFVAFGRSAMSNLNSWASASWNAIGGWVRGTGGGLARWASSAASSIASFARSAWNSISRLASAIGERVGGAFSTVGTYIANTAASIGSWAYRNANWLLPTAAVVAVGGSAIATALTGGAAAPALVASLALAPVAFSAAKDFKGPAYATGGIVDYDHIARVGEGGKREAIIPLENSRYMAPFSAAVARDLVEMLKDQMGYTPQGGQEQQPILYVGTLIADDRSIRELERRMRIVRMDERGRGVMDV